MSETEQLSNIDETVIKVLNGSKVVALVGASPKPERASHRVMNYMLQRGYEVIPVNPVQKGNEILGQTVVGSLLEIDKPIKSAVVAFVGPSSGHLTGEATLMRQGKSTIMMDATLNGEKGIGTKTLLVYGDDQARVMELGVELGILIEPALEALKAQTS